MFLIPNNIKKNDCSLGLISLSDDASAIRVNAGDTAQPRFRRVSVCTRL